MAREILFSGDALELLAALDASGCVLTEEARFFCNLEGETLPFNSRLPVRIKGDFAPGEEVYKIRFRVLPAPRIALLGGSFLTAALGCLAAGNLRGAALFGILAAALGVNFAAQRKSCLRRFASFFEKL